MPVPVGWIHRALGFPGLSQHLSGVRCFFKRSRVAFYGLKIILETGRYQNRFKEITELTARRA
jgi:hypothetical protein